MAPAVEPRAAHDALELEAVLLGDPLRAHVVRMDDQPDPVERLVLEEVADEQSDRF
jgi:hypothetical protein